MLNKIMNFLGYIPKKEIEDLSKTLHNLKETINVQSKEYKEAIKEIANAQKQNVELKVKNEKLNQEITDIKCSIKKDEIITADKIIIKHKIVKMAKNMISHVGYEDSARDVYHKVEFRFYNKVNSHIAYNLTFNSFNIYSVNGKEFAFGKTKDMARFLNELIASNEDILIIEVK